MLSEIAFWILSTIAVAGALTTVFSKNPVYSVLALIVTFFAIAGHYLLLNAQFLAMVHVMVYTGAIMVLFLYVVMMLNLNHLDEHKKSFGSKVLAVVTGGILMLVLVAAVQKTHELDTIVMPKEIHEMGLTKNLGTVLFREFLIPFETASVLFLSAMVAAVYLSKKEKHSEGN